MENTDLAPLRHAELAALISCACRFAQRCNPASQKIARVLNVEPTECLLFRGHQTHTNPTSRDHLDPGF